MHEKNNIYSILFPSLMMILISIISFTDIFRFFNFYDMDMKGLFIIGLVLIFPILFLVQGVVSLLTNTNAIISLLVSVTTYIILMLVFLNDSAGVYIIYYSLAYIVGYVITKFINKIKATKAN